MKKDKYDGKKRICNFRGSGSCPPPGLSNMNFTSTFTFEGIPGYISPAPVMIESAKKKKKVLNLKK